MQTKLPPPTKKAPPHGKKEEHALLFGRSNQHGEIRGRSEVACSTISMVQSALRKGIHEGLSRETSTAEG